MLYVFLSDALERVILAERGKPMPGIQGPVCHSISLIDQRQMEIRSDRAGIDRDGTLKRPLGNVPPLKSAGHNTQRDCHRRVILFEGKCQLEFRISLVVPPEPLIGQPRLVVLGGGTLRKSQTETQNAQRKTQNAEL